MEGCWKQRPQKVMLSALDYSIIPDHDLCLPVNLFTLPKLVNHYSFLTGQGNFNQLLEL